jgi:hypothetical protein
MTRELVVEAHKTEIPDTIDAVLVEALRNLRVAIPVGQPILLLNQRNQLRPSIWLTSGRIVQKQPVDGLDQDPAYHPHLESSGICSRRLELEVAVEPLH